MKISARVVLMAVAIVFSGCSSQDVVKDSDRIVIEYNRQIWGQVAVIASAIGGLAPDEAAVLSQLAADGNTASAHLVEIWGPPKVAPPPYSRQNLLTAIASSKNAHASIWLHPMALAGYAAMALLAGLKVAGKFFPGVGTFVSSAAGKALESVAGAIVDLKHKADTAPDDKIHLEDIQTKMTELRENPAIDALLKRAHVDALVDSSITRTSPQTPEA